MQWPRQVIGYRQPDIIIINNNNNIKIIIIIIIIIIHLLVIYLQAGKYRCCVRHSHIGYVGYIF